MSAPQTDIMPVYLNNVQRDVMNIVQAKDIVLVAGRGFGKSMVQALWLRRNLERMPGCMIGVVSPNAKRANTNTLPSVFQHWEKWGLKRNQFWCVGIKPPKAWHWKQPIFPVQNFENVVSFYNGSICYIISQDRAGTSNSQSYDALTIDEAKFIDFEQLKDETFPAMRGNRQYFGRHYYHHSMLITSDMPVTKKGSWFLDYKDKCNPELIEVIRSLAYEIARLECRVKDMKARGVQPPAYLRGKYIRMCRDLCQLRAAALDYREVSSIDNLAILGEQTIRNYRRDLPPLTFRTSVLCKRIGMIKDGFYSSMTEQHKYSATNFSALDNCEHDPAKITDAGSLIDTDVKPDGPICIAFDFNANINWLVAGQVYGGILHVVKSFYVKYERKLNELVSDFCQYYRRHDNKTVIFYYDATAKQGAYAVDDLTFAKVITIAFQSHGWSVECVDIGPPMKHVLKHLLINRMFARQEHLVPMFNRENNEDLLVAIQTAGMYNGGKDKRREKLAETVEDKLELRTDGTDAFDTLCIGCEKFPRTSLRYFVTSSF